MQDAEAVAQILAAEGIADYEQDLRSLSAEDLRGQFAFASSGRLNTTRVIKNLVWQAYTQIRDGRRARLRATCAASSIPMSSRCSPALASR